MLFCSLAIHMAQPWFHSKLSRDEAHKLITQHGLIDGYFLFHVLFYNTNVSFILIFYPYLYILYTFYILLHNLNTVV